ncbi:MAG: DMT family transporter [Bacteroidales bacterium]|nr:DMT family transporter [Bacteroidales bacterium]
MIIQPKIKGYLLALIATISVSTVYIFSKAALQEVSLPQFGVYWFAGALLWNTLFTMRSAEHRRFHRISLKSFKILFILGTIEIIATASFYGAIEITPNPAIPSFLRNMEYVFVTLFGVFLLKEKFSPAEVLGIVLTFTGALVISYQKSAPLSSYFTGTAGLMFITTLFFGARTIIAKKNIRVITPTMLAINRAIYLLLFSLLILKITGHSFVIPTSALINIAFGSFFGPFITSISQYSSLKYIEASRAAIIQSTTALFVLVGAYFIFGRFPADYQLAGGALTISGAMLLVLGKRLKWKRN